MKVDESKVGAVKKDIEALEELLKAETKDVTKLKAKLEEVNKKVHELSTEMYQKAAAEQQAAHGKPKAEGTDKKEEVVDAAAPETTEE